uniref:DNA repair protein RecN n=1 Tax=uncultured Thiotrichaceae bacterium TaxID=298394 RepID=A0A6S6U965_9GAMM|nr:MAG: DNA repair protein RecN [uncultured Thiotrichaceae bacterium]
MLTHIHIRDFAIIDELSLELHQGMTALTGETGAGKSILLDAIGLVLGDKADSGSIRHGAKKAEITLTVDISYTPHARKWLEEKELDSEENECILRRVIAANGKSRAFINGSPSTLTLIRELGEQMVDIHGQHEHQSLMKRDSQRHMLDDFAGNESILLSTRKQWEKWKELHERLHILSSENQHHQERIDLLRFQTQELENLALEKGELLSLDEELNRLANAEQLKTLTEQCYDTLYDAEPSLYSTLSHQIQELTPLTDVDNRLEAPVELLNSIQIQIQESAYILRDYTRELELDPQRLQWVETRIADIRTMARKHRMEPELLADHLTQLQTELKKLDSNDYDMDAVQQQLDEAAEKYQQHAQKLSTKRIKSAQKLSSGVSKAMQELGMQGGVFSIQVTPETSATFLPQGTDHIEFMVSANPGQPPKPLTKVASGGELSRISLAIQIIAAQKLTLPALIFDEVDTGIGGGIAEVVGAQLRTLSQGRQVLCVTHLPQVASQAHQHYLISKNKEKTSTSTNIQQLEQDERTEEIARMIGGIEITSATRALAEEMLNNKE